MDSELINSIKELSKPIVEQEDLFLVDVEEKGGNETELWIYVDSVQGDVNVEACARISRELAFVLDAHDAVPGRYRLNVSSPGLSRPLTDPRQYSKNRGRIARVKFRGSGGYEKLEGVLKEVSGNDATIELEDGESRSVALDTIVETKIIPKI